MTQCAVSEGGFVGSGLEAADEDHTLSATYSEVVVPVGLHLDGVSVTVCDASLNKK